MIEIIKNAMEEPMQMICEDCSSIFKYTYDEIRSESSTNLLGTAFYHRFVVCPVCRYRNQINTIKAGGKEE